MGEKPLPASARLEFRRWNLSDVDRAFALWGDSQVMRFLGGPYDTAQAAARLEREIANDEAYGIQYWPVFLLESGEHVGCCGLKPYQPANRFFEIGFHLRPQFWGAGYATEAARAVVDFAARHLQYAALFAGHHPQNDVSGRLLRNLGFRQIGTHFYAPTGLEHPWYRLDGAE